MDVGTWLGSLGLGQYEAVFREHYIDADLLTELTDQHLSELGIPLGHRLRMLRAIRELAGNLDDSGQRKLTILCCDLVGSTELTAQLDPEDMADLIRAFQGAVAAAVARFDGHIAKWMGDGALVCFGYPRAHQDDAERATRAGLALIDAVGTLRQERDISLRIRIGISTGAVVVGASSGKDEVRSIGLVGKTPALAMQLQAAAEPDTILVSDSTGRLLDKTFELRSPARRTIRALAAEVPAWRVLHERKT